MQLRLLMAELFIQRPKLKSIYMVNLHKLGWSTVPPPGVVTWTVWGGRCVSQSIASLCSHHLCMSKWLDSRRAKCTKKMSEWSNAIKTKLILQIKSIKIKMMFKILQWNNTELDENKTKLKKQTKTNKNLHTCQPFLKLYFYCLFPLPNFSWTTWLHYIERK